MHIHLIQICNISAFKRCKFYYKKIIYQKERYLKYRRIMVIPFYMSYAEKSIVKAYCLAKSKEALKSWKK